MNSMISVAQQSQILAWIEQDKEQIIQSCQRLVQCPTPSDVGDTRAAMAVVQAFLDETHSPYEMVQKQATMPNLLASTAMAKSGKHLMLNGYLDVMPAGKEVGWKYAPYSGKKSRGQIWGRGTQDMKAGVVAMLFAYRYVLRLQSQLAGRLSLSLVSDEETGYGFGTGYLFEQREAVMLADCVLTAEPSGIDAISYSSKGYLQFRVSVNTRGAIAGYRCESESAVGIACDIIRELKLLEHIAVQLPEPLRQHLADKILKKNHRLVRGKGHSALIERMTVDICQIQGGCFESVIAADCVFSVAIVMPVGTEGAQIFEQVQQIIAKYPSASLELDGMDDGEMSPEQHELVAILQQTVQHLTGTCPVLTPDVALSDCRYWRYRGIPAYWYGVDGSKCSAANESVKIDELIHLVKAYIVNYFELDNEILIMPVISFASPLCFPREGGNPR